MSCGSSYIKIKICVHVIKKSKYIAICLMLNKQHYLFFSLKIICLQGGFFQRDTLKNLEVTNGIVLNMCLIVYSLINFTKCLEYIVTYHKH